MAINFNSLPDGRPNKLPEAGEYVAVVESAEMKQGKDQAKPPYLNMKLGLYNKETNAKVGTIYDMLFETEAELLLFKLKQFMVAIGLSVMSGGSIELKDISKICVGKKFYTDIKIEKNEQYGDKAIVDVFKNDIFRPYVEEESPFLDAPINAPDGETESSEEY